MVPKLSMSVIAICAGMVLPLRDAAAASEASLERGAYLVKAVVACGRCHTPRNAEGKAIPGLELAGGLEFDDPGVGHVVTPNITPDRETGIGNWTEAEIFVALRNATRPDGSVIASVMPSSAYHQLSDSDTSAIAAYLRKVKPIRHAVQKNPRPAEPPTPLPSDNVVAPPRKDGVAYGGYVATIAHCIGCHTPLREGGQQLDRRRAFTGGRELPEYGRPGLTVSTNITADPENGLGKWSDADIKRAITRGIRPDGSRLSRTMPFEWYSRMTPSDLHALVSYFRTQKPEKNNE